MYCALLFFVKKDAIAVFSGFDGEPSIFFVAESGDERGWIDSKKIGDPLYFIPADKDPAFAVTAGPASFTFKGFHEKISKVFLTADTRRLASAQGYGTAG